MDTGVLFGTCVLTTSRDRTLEIAPQQAFSEGGEIIEHQGLQKASCGLCRFEFRPGARPFAGSDQNGQRAGGVGAFKVVQGVADDRHARKLHLQTVADFMQQPRFGFTAVTAIPRAVRTEIGAW